MGIFPFSFRTRTSQDARLDSALAANFAKAATEDYVDTAVAAVVGSGGPPSGAAGGVLSGTYPNPGFASDMATQAELDAEASTRSTADTTLQTNITNEATARASADTTLQANIDTATAARALADVGLAQRIDDLSDDLGAHHHDARYYTKVANDALLSAYLTTAAAAAGYQPLDADLTTIAGLDSGTSAGVMGTDGAGWVKKTYAQVKTLLSLTKSDVGLSNVDNTSDVNKPISTATQAALDLKAPLASPTFTGTVTASGATAVTVPTVAIGAGSNAATIGAVNTALGAYLTTASASATYLTIANAAATYWPLSTDLATQVELDAEAATRSSADASEAASRALADVGLTQRVDDLADDFTSHHHDGRYLQSLANVYKGAWSASTQYAIGDVVIYSGHTLIATSTPTLADPPYGSSSGTWDYSTWDGSATWGGYNGWTYLAARGQAGTNGTNGTGQQYDFDGLKQRIDDLSDDFGVHHHDTRYLYRPATPADGSVLTSDTLQTGGVKWRKREIATQLWTAATGAQASGTTLASFSLTGDGATAIYIHGQWDIDTSVTGNWVSVRVYDSTIGAGATVCQENIMFHVTGSLRMSHTVCYRVAPFTGTKTITLKVEASGGTITVYGGSGGGSGGNSMGAFAEWA